MIDFTEYLDNLFIMVIFGMFAGYVYGLLFVKKQTEAFLLLSPKWKLFLFDFLRLFVFGCIIGYLLINDLYKSILMIICFLVVFWIKLLF
jgi:hypothetical protein